MVDTRSEVSEEEVEEIRSRLNLVAAAGEEAVREVATVVAATAAVLEVAMAAVEMAEAKVAVATVEAREEEATVVAREVEVMEAERLASEQALKRMSKESIQASYTLTAVENELEAAKEMSKRFFAKIGTLEEKVAYRR